MGSDVTKPGAHSGLAIFALALGGLILWAIAMLDEKRDRPELQTMLANKSASD